MKLINVHKNVMSGQCKNSPLRIQIRYTAFIIFPSSIPGWAGSHLGLFTPRKTKDGYSCTGVWFRPWLAPDVSIYRLPKWYVWIMNFLSFRFD